MSKFVFETYYPNSHAYPTVVNDYVMNKNLLLDKFQSNCYFQNCSLSLVLNICCTCCIVSTH